MHCAMQFKKREKHQKITPPWVFFTFLKLHRPKHHYFFIGPDLKRISSLSVFAIETAKTPRPNNRD